MNVGADATQKKARPLSPVGERDRAEDDSNRHFMGLALYFSYSPSQ